MQLETVDAKPIYIQIAEWLENGIIKGSLPEEERVYSQYQLADLFNINPATAAKGLNLLADDGIVYKKRGLGMFVAPGARETLLQKRREETLHAMITGLAAEAERLNVPDATLFEQITQARQRMREGRQ